MVTVAIYLHLRGLHAGPNAGEPAPPLIEGTADLDETEESTNEIVASNETVTYPGERE